MENCLCHNSKQIPKLFLHGKFQWIQCKWLYSNIWPLHIWNSTAFRTTSITWVSLIISLKVYRFTCSMGWRSNKRPSYNLSGLFLSVRSGLAPRLKTILKFLPCEIIYIIIIFIIYLVSAWNLEIESRKAANNLYVCVSQKFSNNRKTKTWMRKLEKTIQQKNMKSK